MDARSGDPVVAAVLGEAQADADTVGLLLAGSRGAGQADAQSDYDFVWVLSDLAYQDRAERGGPWDVARRIGGHKVELSFASPAVLRELAERPSWRNSDYATAVVLLDRGDLRGRRQLQHGNRPGPSLAPDRHEIAHRSQDAEIQYHLYLMNEPLSGLAIEGLTVAYDDRVVLADASLRCRRGEVVGLLGPNGSGKSSLLKGVLGLVPRVAGRVELDGAPLDRRRRARVAYTPQRGEVDWGFPITVEEVVLLGRQAHLGLLGRPGRADRAIAAEALERLGLLAQRREQIGELSGGQQQRVFLARALAQRGDVLLLDEPLTGVDAQTQSAVLALLEELRRDGQAIVVATHDLPQAAALCDRICMLNGRVVAVGPPEEVLTREVLADTYGGTGLIELPRRDGVVGVLADLPVALPHGAGPACDH